MSSPSDQTCTGCRRAKTPADFWRRNKDHLTCNQCAERLRVRKAAKAAERNAQKMVSGRMRQVDLGGTRKVVVRQPAVKQQSVAQGG